MADLATETGRAAANAAFAAATTSGAVFGALTASGKALLQSILNGFGAGIEVVTGSASIFAQLVQDLAQVDRKVFQSFDKVYESVIKATFGFFLNPLIAGVPLPELREENVYGAFSGEPCRRMKS